MVKAITSLAQITTVLCLLCPLRLAGARITENLEVVKEGFTAGFNVLSVSRLAETGDNVVVFEDTTFRRSFLARVEETGQSPGSIRLEGVTEIPALDEFVNFGLLADVDEDQQTELLLLTNRFLYVCSLNPSTLREVQVRVRWGLYGRVGTASQLDSNEVMRPGSPLSTRPFTERGYLIAVGDVTNNGSNEILVSAHAGRTQHGFSFVRVILLSYKNEELNPQLNFLAPAEGWEGLQVIDFDGDGHNEIVVPSYHVINFRRFNSALADLDVGMARLELYPNLAGQRVYFVGMSSLSPPSLVLLHVVSQAKQRSTMAVGREVVVFGISPATRHLFGAAGFLGPAQLTPEELARNAVWVDSTQLQKQRTLKLSRTGADQPVRFRHLLALPMGGSNNPIILNTALGFFLFR
ncbi:MAG: FG-GAP repeat domain-containing protein [Acidobacteriota bacterium]